MKSKSNGTVTGIFHKLSPIESALARIDRDKAAAKGWVEDAKKRAAMKRQEQKAYDILRHGKPVAIFWQISPEAALSDYLHDQRLRDPQDGSLKAIERIQEN